jgi:hypothetical protein
VKYGNFYKGKPSETIFAGLKVPDLFIRFIYFCRGTAETSEFYYRQPKKAYIYYFSGDKA